MRIRKKLRRAKRLTYLALLVGAVIAVRRAQAARRARTKLGPPASWPPLEPGEPPVAAVGTLADVLVPDPAAAPPTPTTPTTPPVSDEPVAAVGAIAADDLAPWVAAEDGACPTTHPVKANDNSGIYHVPGGQHYDRTRAERCYSDVAAAEADGYRAARTNGTGS